MKIVFVTPLHRDISGGAEDAVARSPNVGIIACCLLCFNRKEVKEG